MTISKAIQRLKDLQDLLGYDAPIAIEMPGERDNYEPAAFCVQSVVETGLRWVSQEQDNTTQIVVVV